MSSQSSTNSGVRFAGLLTLLFTALKLTKVIDWSWWWVLSPVWISFIIGIIFVIFVAIFMIIDDL